MDGSVAIHSCHGQPRQIEVLRDALLHLLNETQVRRHDGPSRLLGVGFAGASLITPFF